MEDNIRFLLVTANENETNALLNDSQFCYDTKRSNDPYDTAFYNIGTYGCYEAIHFELNSQGSIGADASQLAIVSAINSFHPDAVILVGIAFGKDFHDSINPSQKIGDVLISDTVADYESGKVKNGEVLSDGFIAESGRQLQSAFKYCAKSWNHTVKGKKAKCEFGMLLSGDKVVDDRDFKEKLIKSYPRSIGGEMEGRGAYSACRNRNINEWIIVKSICDWADGTKSEDKQENQIIAAESAVSLLNHIFTNPKSFEKIPKIRFKENNIPLMKTSSNYYSNDVIGYFINFGVTTCRLFEILKEGKILKERQTISYDISNPKDPTYLKGTAANLKRLFKKFENGTAIVNIGLKYIDIMVRKGNKFDMHNLKFTLEDVSNYISKHAIPEIWDESTISQIKDFIGEKIKGGIERIKAKSVVIIKDELKFMTELGYPLKFEDGCNCISFESYKKANREFLFNIDYRNEVNVDYSDSAIANRMYGFKNGHIILEEIFECIGTEKVIPSDELSIHGSLNAYIFNVVISGSAKDERAKYMIEAHKIMTEMGATVLSPRVVNGKLSKQTVETDINHANAIRECDLLFVSNKDKYIGEQTAREIYGAFILNKPIAFWRESNNVERLEYIPHEQWWNLMKFLENSEE